MSAGDDDEDVGYIDANKIAENQMKQNNGQMQQNQGNNMMGMKYEQYE